MYWRVNINVVLFFYKYIKCMFILVYNVKIGFGVLGLVIFGLFG